MTGRHTRPPRDRTGGDDNTAQFPDREGVTEAYLHRCGKPGPFNDPCTEQGTGHTRHVTAAGVAWEDRE